MPKILFGVASLFQSLNIRRKDIVDLSPKAGHYSSKMKSNCITAVFMHLAIS